MIAVYGLKSCDACRKTLKALAKAGVEANAVDIRADGVSEDTIADWLSRLGPDALVNRRSTTWRGLDDAARAQAETAEGARALLARRPTLIKRPVIVDGDELYVGWTAETKAALT